MTTPSRNRPALHRRRRTYRHTHCGVCHRQTWHVLLLGDMWRCEMCGNERDDPWLYAIRRERIMSNADKY